MIQVLLLIIIMKMDEEESRDMYAYFFGDELFVCPVLKKGAEKHKVYLPDGKWVHLWTGKRYRRGVYTVPAPVGQPPVFRRADCADADLFDKLVQE